MNEAMLARLHKPPAYQNAVMRLILYCINDLAKKLELRENLPVSVPDHDHGGVNCPPDGIGGSILTTNYSYNFVRGRLRSVRKQNWLQKVSPPARDMYDLARQQSLLDNESAHQLAVKWLAAIGINVPELERRFPPRVFQLQVMRDRTQRILEPTPLFMIGWGEDTLSAHLRANHPGIQRRQRPPNSTSPVFVELLGTTKELIDLSIYQPDLFNSPPMELANAAELIGPLPEPRQFVEQKFGGAAGYQTMAAPDKVEAWLLDSKAEGTARTNPVIVKRDIASGLSQTLTDFDSWHWDDRFMKGCLPEYGVQLHFARGTDTVDVLICFMCDMLQIRFNGAQVGGGDFLACRALARAVKATFPHDRVVQQLRD